MRSATAELGLDAPRIGHTERVRLINSKIEENLRGVAAMKARTLGYVVLVYAALTSYALYPIGLPWKGLTSSGFYSWLVLGTLVLWIGYVLSGLGLLFGRTWSRLLLLVTFSASILKAVVFGLLTTPLWRLPAIAAQTFIFVAALRLKPRAAREIQPSPAAVDGKPVSTRLDLAYGCFALVALLSGAIGLMGHWRTVYYLVWIGRSF